MKKILIWGFAFLLSVGAYGKELNEYLGKVQTLEKSKKYKEIDTIPIIVVSTKNIFTGIKIKLLATILEEIIC